MIAEYQACSWKSAEFFIPSRNIFPPVQCIFAIICIFLAFLTTFKVIHFPFCVWKDVDLMAEFGEWFPYHLTPKKKKIGKEEIDLWGSVKETILILLRVDV